MEEIIFASIDNIDDILNLRVEQQIEDWEKTLGKCFDEYIDAFYKITKEHLINNLNNSIYFAIMYVDGYPVAMSAVEELNELPQITLCVNNTLNNRHGWIVSVYTKPNYRGKGYQQKLIKSLLDFSKKVGFNEITLTTNTDDAKHIYEKSGFRYISDKYFLSL